MKVKAKRNRTLALDGNDIVKYSKKLISLKGKRSLNSVLNKTINQNIFEAVAYLPDQFVDLMIVDPPYNLHKSFNQFSFRKKSVNEYEQWIDGLLTKLKRILKPDASLYFCSDWFSSTSVHIALDKHFKVQNRISWERDKGRGSKKNWKNNLEDIWFCTVSSNYKFNTDAVKLKKKVIAPYRHDNGDPKDWVDDNGGGGIRMTYPSNIWTDITIPFWSMPENTVHPTQKPEKLLAKLILASSDEGDVIFDPFLGSGTTSVTAKKLNRNYCGVELDNYYACLAEKRLELADNNKKIQGFSDGIFWERNSYFKNNGNK